MKFAKFQASDSCRLKIKMWHRSVGVSNAGFDRESPTQKPSRCSCRNCNPVAQLICVTVVLSALLLVRSFGTESGAYFLPPMSWGISHRLSTSVSAEDLTHNNMTWLMKQFEEYGITECDKVRTENAHLFGLPKPSSKQNIQLPTDENIDLLLVSYSADGKRRCSGGDFYETDLAGTRWKSRPPVKDLGDGAYLVRFYVHRDFAGVYSFKADLLFSNLHGLDYFAEGWKIGKQVVSYQIEFVDSNFTASTPEKPKLKLCTDKDFRFRNWEGRWTRWRWNESCTTAGADGRHRCLDPNETCRTPWCEGPVGSLESNGWVYSAHCSFRIFKTEEAWKCLNGRWIYSWGDSNQQDTLYNLLTFILGRQEKRFPRNFDERFRNPNNGSEEFRLTHRNSANYEGNRNWAGLSSLDNEGYRQGLLDPAFLPNATAAPDAMILNSGLHDGMYFLNLSHYVEGVGKAVTFWESVWRGVSEDRSRRPKIIYRTTVAPAGKSRGMTSNPHKMDAFNTLLVESLLSKFGYDADIHIVDDFDMTFPWHFDNNCSDGGHYGRPPALNSWLGITTGHEYFVDLMLAHVHLNVLCPSPF